MSFFAISRIKIATEYITKDYKITKTIVLSALPPKSKLVYNLIVIKRKSVIGKRFIDNIHAIKASTVSLATSVFYFYSNCEDEIADESRRT